MLAGAADAAIIPSNIGGFIACKALSKRNDEPQRASRPWDVDRDGFVMGEGAGVLVLEELEHAKVIDRGVSHCLRSSALPPLLPSPFPLSPLAFVAFDYTRPFFLILCPLHLILPVVLSFI